MSRLLSALAAGAPVPVFAVAGAGARELVQDVRLQSALRLVDTPSHASVLLVAGTIPEDLAEPLRRVHDSMPHPRCSVWWRTGAVRGPSPLLPEAALVEGHGDVVAAIVRAHRGLLSGERPSDPPIVTETGAEPWRGVGPYGQGGGGMTGGTPYGRPMPGLSDDRDGLRLDVLPLRIGPFFPRFPTGLLLDAEVAGDVFTAVSVGANPFAKVPLGPADLGRDRRPFVRALSEPSPIADLEMARARSHLRWLAEALVAQGLPALALRTLRLAAGLRPHDAPEVARLARFVERTQVMRWSVGSVGRIDVATIDGLGLGPVARASGLAEDARSDDPAYRVLGFEPVVGERGDVAARWRQRVAEVMQSLDLATRAGEQRTELTGRVESPHGRLEQDSAPDARLLGLVPDLLVDREWGDAVATLVSLDLDFEEAAAVGSPAGAAGLA